MQCAGLNLLLELMPRTEVSIHKYAGSWRTRKQIQLPRLKVHHDDRGIISQLHHKQLLGIYHRTKRQQEQKIHGQQWLRESLFECHSARVDHVQHSNDCKRDPVTSMVNLVRPKIILLPAIYQRDALPRFFKASRLPAPM